MWTTDRDLRVTAAGDPGWVGARLDDCLGPDAGLLDLHRRALGGHDGLTEVEEGSRTFDVRVTPLRDEAGAIVGAAAVRFDVTERRRAADALRESEAQLRAIWDHSDLGISLTDAETGRLIAVNRELAALVGKAPEDLTHVRVFDELTHPDDRAADAAHFASIMSGELDRARMAKRFVLDDGRRVWASLVFSLVRDASGKPHSVLCMAEDVTERRQAEEALRESEARFRTLFEDASVGIALCNQAGDVVMANQACLDMLGLERDELRRIETFDELTHPDDREEDARRQWELVHGAYDQFRQSKRYVLRDGRLVWAELSVYLVRDQEGKPLYSVGVMQDVTQQKLAEQERERLELELQHAQKMEAVGRLAGGVAHDFNNLLTAVRGYTEFVLNRLPEGAEEQRRDLEEVLRAADRAAELTRHLLAFGRKQIVEPRVLDLNEVVRETEKLLRRLIGEHIALEVALDAAEAYVRADPGQLEQVLVNLAINARDAMPAGGTLTIATRDVVVDGPQWPQAELLPQGPYLLLAVGDTGEGMDEEVLRRAFEPFFTTKATGEGTGLGLSTVYGIVTQSGGSISAESRAGAGTTFSVLLPRVARSLPSEERPSVGGHPGGDETVLVVEDEDVVRRLVAKMLVALGYTVLAAGSATEAVARFDEAGGRVDLLLTDLVMPGGGGYELAERLSARAPSLSVLYMSGYSEAPPAGARPAAGILLEKPFERGRLARAVRQALDVRGREPVTRGG